MVWVGCLYCDGLSQSDRITNTLKPSSSYGDFTQYVMAFFWGTGLRMALWQYRPFYLSLIRDLSYSSRYEFLPVAFNHNDSFVLQYTAVYCLTNSFLLHKQVILLHVSLCQRQSDSLGPLILH